MKLLPIALLLTLSASPLFAQHAHEHGVARLGLVQSGSEVGVEWSGPLDTVVGFEHAPSTAAEKQALADAIERLRNPVTVVSMPPAAGCQLMSANVAMPFQAEDAEGEHEHEHEHEDEQEKGEGADAMHGEHADLIVTYDFTCQHPEALKVVQVTAFDSFERLQRVEAAVLTDTRQGAARLTRENTAWTLPTP
ncbi:DUF2796 domain-containing protein [Nitrogeniibacter aestuarii]|uniref:DUF2796 domain-containing protein n=1 Tax=Nitrogeniibacter aestuarii TaxID=2815343 RepID=UPI001E529968|nr:DUF2796 domain-containing protein [Nitrogeniibacter aestuarii]